MILGLGIDVVEIARIERILAGPPDRAERFLSRCFTAAEREYGDAGRDRAARHAVRFAAKEAAFKALGVPPGIAWTDVEIARGGGPPRLELHGAAAERARALGVARTLVSLTHDGGVAVAVVALDGEPS